MTMFFQLVDPVSIDWHKHTIKVNWEDTIWEVPFHFTTTTLFNKLKADKFKAVLIGNTKDDMIAILIFKAMVEKE